MEDKCSYVDMYCVISYEKIIDPSCLGYIFYSNYCSNEERYSRLSDLCQNRKGNKKYIFSILNNKSSSKPQNIYLDGKQLLYPIRGLFELNFGTYVNRRLEKS